jgi:hypothetical protein
VRGPRRSIATIPPHRGCLLPNHHQLPTAPSHKRQHTLLTHTLFVVAITCATRILRSGTVVVAHFLRITHQLWLR